MKKFRKWLKKEYKWIFKSTYILGYEEAGFSFCPICGGDFKKVGYAKSRPFCLHSVEGGISASIKMAERKSYLKRAYFIAIKAKSFKEIKQNKNKNRNWYWSYLALQEFNKQESPAPSEE